MAIRRPPGRAVNRGPGKEKNRAATLWWLADGVAAAIFAGGIALAVAMADGMRILGLVLMLVAGALRAAIQVAATDSGQAAAMTARRNLRARLFPALITSALRRGRPVGEDVRLAVDTVHSLEGWHARYLPLRTAAVGGPLLIAAITAFASPIAAAILIATLIPFAFGMMLAGTAAARAADRQLTALTRLSGLFLDRVRALPEIRLFRAEDRIVRQIGEASRDAAERTLSVMRIAFVSGATIEFFAAIAVALVAVYCGFNLLGLLPFPVPEKLELWQAFFALAMAPEFYLPMRRLAAAYHDRQQGEAAFAAIESAAPETAPRKAGIDSFEGLIAHRIAVQHPDGPAIGPIGFTLPATGLTTIEGPTGSGKSSILHAIAGLLPHEGQLGWVAGSRPAIGWAGQRVLLLPGSIADSIALGRPDASRAEIEAAARMAGLHPLIRARGLDAELDDSGSGLSGGERRRIGIARAFLSGRPLLILDEPTADLDGETAAALIATLHRLSSETAILVATHDPALSAVAAQRIALP